MRRLGLALVLVTCGPPTPAPVADVPPVAAPRPAVPDPPAPSPSPDDPALRELTAICLSELTAGLRPGEPMPDRFARALVAAEDKAVSADSKALLRRLGDGDLGERAAVLTAAAAAAGVAACPLAMHMQAVVDAVPNFGDARNLVTTLEALESVAPEYLDRLYLMGCSELPGCGGACASGLADAAAAEPGLAEELLRRGCADFRAAAGGSPPASVSAWIRARVSAYADRCAPLLLGEDAGRLAGLRKNLGL